MSKIEWTDDAWNPIIGCTGHSAACDHCYAISVATRFAGQPMPAISKFDLRHCVEVAR